MLGANVEFKHGGHVWQLADAYSRSGKTLWECTMCGLRDPAPVKDKYESRACERGKWEHTYRQPDGSDWPSVFDVKGGE